MFVIKLLFFIVFFQLCKWFDEEIVEDFDYFKDEFKFCLDGFSIYDEYVKEFESGYLVWLFVYEMDDFWKENGIRIGQEEGGKVVKLVIEFILI